MKLKRLIALLLVVIIPAALIFTGCASKKEMTPQEYYDGILEAYKEYGSAIKELAPIIETAKDLDSVAAVSESAKDICGRADKALTKFEDLTPPSKYADKHKKLIAALEEEHKFVKAAEKLLTAKTLDDITSANDDLQAYANLPQDQLFPVIMLDLVMELKAEIG